MADSTGLDHTIEVHAIDTQSGAQFIIEHGAAISRAWQRAALINYDMNAPARFLDFGDLWVDG
jgi:hypothetical protein